MLDAMRNWLDLRTAMKGERRRRSTQAQLNTVLVQDKLKHIAEMLEVGQRVYATRTMDEILARFPDEAAELPMTLNVLIILGRLDEAERLTLRGIQRNPDSRDYARLYCEVADYRGDVAERLRRWGAFRRRYPAYGLGIRMEAMAMIAAGREEAAEKLLTEGVSVVKDDLDLAIEYARRAEARRDWPEAGRRWAVVLNTFDNPIGASRVAAALIEQGLFDQAEAALSAARQRFPLDVQLVDDLATLAERRGDVDGALLRWSELRRDLPHVSRGYTEAARLLRNRGEPAAADALITEGAGRSPMEVHLQFAYARLAERQGDWTAAAQRWKTNRARFPADPAPAREEPAALRRLGRLDEAEQELLAAIEQFPTAADLYVQYAEIAEERGDRVLAAERWQAAVAADPGAPAAHLALARALAATGDRAAADAALETAIARLPDEPSLYAAHATLAVENGRAETAAARWAAARQRFGPLPVLVRAEAGGLREQGRLDAARALLTDALHTSPDSFELLHDLGKLAAQEGSWPAAETCWRTIMTRHPEISWAPGELAQALTAQGRAAEADAVLEAAWNAHPKEFGLAAAWAGLPSAAKDWPEAQRRWALVRERFPAEGHPVWQEGIALREAGETEQAGTLFAAGAERFPADASFPHDLARLAEARQDHAQAEHWWRRYQALQPDAWWGWLGLAAAVHAQGRMDEAEDLLLRGDEACPTIHAFLHMRAEWARHCRDWPEAERRATQLAARFPDAWEGIWGQSVAVREQGRLDEARALLLRGADQHSNINIFAHDLARVAESRAEWAEAERWWHAFLALDDNQPWAHGALAHALYRQGRTEDADRHLLDAIGRHPDDIAFNHQYALAADHLGDPLLSRQRWRTVVERFPHDAKSLGHLAGAHAATGETEEATRLLIAGLERFPADRSFIRSLMTIATDRRDEAAAAKWRARLVEMLRRALETQPDDPSLLIEFVQAMAALPQSEWPLPALQIERSLQAAIDGGNPDGLLHAAYAGIAAGRADWSEQYRRLQASVERFPNDAYLRTKLFAAREIMLAAAEHAPPDDHRAIAPDGAHPDLPPGDLVLYFESLGGGGAQEEGWGFGCEFGYFQREYGQEPLSLLRWASIGPKYLIRALNEDFAGFGNPEAIRLADDSGDDWAVDDTAYQSRFDHTHLSRVNVPRDEAQRLVAMRMKFLARKLVGDLQAGEKIFVYRVIDRELTEATILRLAQAVNRFGRNILLFVALADDHHPAFLVRHVHPGLMIGYINFFRARGGRFREWNHDGWLRLCREALRVWQANAPETPDVPPTPDFQDEADGQHQTPLSSPLDGMNQALLDPAGMPADDSPIPRDFAAACAWARQAVEAKDWSEAQQRWAQLRDHFPAEGHPWWQEAIALREAGQVSEAQALLLAGASRFPHDSSFPHDLARLAEGRGDWPEAERWWRAFLGIEPELWWGHTGLGHALAQQGRIEDAEAVLQAAQGRLPNGFVILLDYARLAERQRDWPEAERRFARLAERFPDLGDGLWGLAAALREQGRLDAAERHLLEGAARHPGHGGFVHDLARLAEARGDWPGAERHWRGFIALEPQYWWAHTGLAAALIAQDRLTDAHTVLQDAATALPDEIGVVIELARLAERCNDWSEALALWTLVRAQAPADLRGHLQGANALRQLGRAEEAEAVLLEAAERRPAEPGLLHDLARAAELRHDWAEAARRWQALAAADPGNWDARLGIASAQCEQGEVAPALDLLAALASEAGADPRRIAAVATLAFQHAPSLAPAWMQSLADTLARAVAAGDAPPSAWLAHALVAKRQEHFADSRARLEAAAVRHPDDLAIRIALADARELAPQEGDTAASSPAADAAMLRHFESLGGNLGGCEFGFHQRAHKFEPLSLLRWASIQPEALCRLLEEQFAGLGAAETVSLRSQGHADWQAVELTYGIQMDHTHLDRRTVTIETATRLVCNMLKFLARKLADDLRLGEKVFIYRMSGAPFPPALVGRLNAAVAAYGAGRMLLVGEDSPAVTERLSPRCLMVLRERIGTDSSDAVRLASWQKILREAAQAFELEP